MFYNMLILPVSFIFWFWTDICFGSPLEIIPGVESCREALNATPNLPIFHFSSSYWSVRFLTFNYNLYHNA